MKLRTLGLGAVGLAVSICASASAAVEGYYRWATINGDCRDTSAANTGNLRYPCFFRPDRIN